MPPRAHFAIELILWRLTEVAGAPPAKVPVLMHYQATLDDAEALARYGACDTILDAPAGATTKESA